MFRFQPSTTLNDAVCRAATDKQTHTQTKIIHRKTFFNLQVLYLFKKNLI